MSIQRSIFTVALIAALAATSVATPSLAKKNDHRFATSNEGLKADLPAADCGGLKNDLDKAEKEADKRAGTKDAKPFADRADFIWGMGVSHACSWAS